MHSYLLVGKDEIDIEKKVAKLAKKLKANLLEFRLSKIRDTRDLNSFLKLSVGQPTAILIKNINIATQEALNAFLKNLEEPQDNIYFILTAGTAYNLPPTIISRCQVIEVRGVKRETKQKLPSSDPEKKMSAAKKFLGMAPSEKLLYINSIRFRDEAVEFIKEFILGTHLLLHSSKSNHRKISFALKSANKTHKFLKANGNVSLQLTNFVINTIPNEI